MMGGKSVKYYVQKNGDVIVAYGCSSLLPDGVAEITEEEYNAGLAALAEADVKAKAEREAKEQAERLARENEAAERQAKIDDYITEVKAGTIKLEEVPEEYRAAVDTVINPPKSESEKKIEELQEQINATTEMLNTVLMSVSQ